MSLFSYLNVDIFRLQNINSHYVIFFFFCNTVLMPKKNAYKCSIKKKLPLKLMIKIHFFLNEM